jgi:hypothetical protein
MHSESITARCPRCGQVGALRFFQHTDEQGHPLRHELEFDCPVGDDVAKNDLADLWAAARGGPTSELTEPARSAGARGRR